VLDLGIEKLALIGVVALIVIGPEKLPRVARTVGMLARQGAALRERRQGRSQPLDGARRAPQDEDHGGGCGARRRAQHPHRRERLRKAVLSGSSGETLSALAEPEPPPVPEYRHPRKNWRLKQGATPQWYKARNGVRTKALSGAARVARFRPHSINKIT
jgi:sec-independent protein translocase protein TatB